MMKLHMYPESQQWPVVVVSQNNSRKLRRWNIFKKQSAPISETPTPPDRTQSTPNLAETQKAAESGPIYETSTPNDKPQFVPNLVTTQEAAETIPQVDGSAVPSSPEETLRPVKQEKPDESSSITVSLPTKQERLPNFFTCDLFSKLKHFSYLENNGNHNNYNFPKPSDLNL